jgi:DNA-binding YbaB/EbfC family protein
MFEKIGQMFSLLRNLPKLKEQMGQLQQRVGQITAEGDAGGGMVRAKVNGMNEVVSVTIADEVLRGGDKELLEDLVRGAINQAIQQVRARVAEETSKMAADMGLPPGMELPGAR